MANWSNPTLSSLYTDFLTEVKNRDVDLALGFDGISPTPSNLPTGAIRWDSSAGRWKKWTGSAWGELAATYALTAVSTTGDVTVGGAIVFEGATANDYETTLTVVDPTADRTITLPNVTGTVITTGDSGTVTSAMIADGAIVNDDINASAAIAYSKLAALTSANILLGNASNVATSTAVTGDVTISNAGITAISAGVIVNADISASAAIAGSKISPDFGTQNSTTTGTSTAASFIPSSATVPANGIYLPAANTVGISTNGTERLRITSTGDVNIKGAGTAGTSQAVSFSGSAPVDSLVVQATTGYVGIGTNAPQSELNIAKTGGASTVYIQSDAGNNATTSILRFGGATGRSASIQGYRGASSNVHSLDFYTYNSADVFGMRLDSSGRLLVGTSTDSGGALFQVNGDRVRIGTAKTPASASATGTTGEICWDASYVYVCTATNTWKRAALATW